MLNKLRSLLRAWSRGTQGAAAPATALRKSARNALLASGPVSISPVAITPMLMEELEPRILHSADLSPVVDADSSLAPLVEHQDLEPETLQTETTSLTEQKTANLELVFVDTATPDYQTLVDDLVSRDGAQRNFEIVLLESDSDGVAQISQALAGRSDISTVHVISHGSDGAIQLGSSLLTNDNLSAYEQEIAGWGDALAGDADLLLYGCELAASSEGRRLVEHLATITGADVAASDDLTGDAALGGDWTLEYQFGDINTAATLSAQTWHGVLATFSVDTFSDTVDANPGDGVAEDASGNTSLRAAIMEANALAGADSIYLEAGTYTLSIAGTNENAAAQGDLDITSEIKITGAGAGATYIDGDGVDRVFDIQPAGDASVTGLTIQNGANVAQGGGVMLTGGGSAKLFLDTVVLKSNVASSEGGAIYNAGDLTVLNSEISGTNTAALGGGLFNALDAALTGVTISGNKADFGGAISNSNLANSLSLVNVTISGNSASNQGGGIYTQQVVDLTNVTVAYNSATSGGGIYILGGAGDAVLKNSILADNSGGNANATLTSSGNNIDTDGSSGIAATLSSDLRLDSTLADNGGPTRTHALLSGSVAINAGDASAAPTTDQRQMLRTDASPDIGAYELNTTPIGGFWISTEADVASPSGVNGLGSWQDGDIVQIGDPGLALEPGGSGASISMVFDIDRFAVDGAAEIDAIHYVTRDITVGTSTTMDLKVGDVLFSTALLENSGFTSTNSITGVQDSDLVLFRPGIPGDYTSGAFSILLDESAISAGNDWLDLGGISLVEKDTLVGDKTLSAGSFILVEGATASRKEIQVFTPDSVGPGTTDGSLELLLDITASGVGLSNAVDGLELIEEQTTIGGETLPKGAILISHDGDASIYMLDVAATEFGTGSAATVSLLLDGNTIGLDTASENVFALTLVTQGTVTTSINTAPLIAAPVSALGASEQTPLAIQGTGFEVKDLDEAGGGALATLSVGEGTITVIEGDSGVMLTGGNGTASVTLTGTIAQINNLLTGTGTGTITYLNNSDSPGSSTTLTVTVNDQGNSGVDPGLTGDAFSEEGSASVTIKITAINDAPAFTSSGPYSVNENTPVGTVVGSVAAIDPDVQSSGTTLIISEIMFDPESSEPRWEWIEVYNPTASTINLAGYVLDDINTLAQTAANISAGIVAPGSTAVLFNADEISADNFKAAWSSGINLIGVSGWGNLQLNNDGDTVSLWASFADYNGDNLTHANAVVTLDYDDVSPWPVPNGKHSIFLTDLSADPANGANWALSSVGAPTPLGSVAYKSTSSGSNSGEDVGSPGDGGPGSPITYSITGNVNPDGDGNAAFSIDSLTGVITVNDAGDLDFETTSSLAITVEASDGTSTTSALVTINLNNVNEAPTVTAPASIAVTEDVASAITGISFADVDAASGAVTASFNVTRGTLAATSGGGVTVGGTSSTLTLTGTLFNINAFIGGSNLSYTTALNDTSAVILAVSVNDGGNTGSGGAQTSGIANITLNVSPVNDAPTVTAPASIAVTEDVASALTGISFADIDAASGNVVATFSVSQGTLAATSAGGVTVGGSATTLTLSGSLSNINAFIGASNLSYTTALNDTSAVNLAVSVNDGGNSGSGGAQTSAITDVTLNVSPVNDAPTLDAFAAPIDTVAEDTEVEITFGDLAAQGNEADVDGSVDAFVIKAVSTGTLKIGATAATAATWVAGSNDTVNATDNAYWTPDTDANGTLDAFTVVARDNNGAESAAAVQAQVNVNAVNDAPTLSAPASIDVTEDVASALTGISFADVDAASGAVTANFNVTRGTLAATSGGGVTVGGGATTLTLSGSVANINAFINASNLTYTSALNDTAAVTLAVSVNDGGNTGSGGAQTSATSNVTLNVSPVNDAPTVTAPASIAVTEDVASAITGISFADIDAASGNVVATFGVSQGTLAATSGGGVTVGGTSSTLTLTGAVADINTFISGSNLTYTTVLNDVTAVNLAVSVNDGGNTGSGGAQTSALSNVTLNVSPVNDAPTVTAPASIAVTEDVASALIGISFADVDAASGIITTSFSVAQGTLTATSGAGVTVGGTATDLTLTGSLTNINAFINASNLTYTTALNNTTAVTLAVSINDGGNSGSGGALSSADTVALNVSPVNDAPTVTAPASITVTEDVASAVTGISFADVDAASGNVVATFSLSQGTLAATSGGGVTVGGSATTLTLTGSLANINAFIGASNLAYTTALNDTSAVNLAVSVNDGGNTGSGGALASPVRNVTLNVSPVNDAPTLTTFAAPIGTVAEDTEVEITFGDLTAQGNEADVDGSVDAFVIKAVSTGTLRIGASATTATAWAAGSNDTVDATNNAYWTPAADTNGMLDAFTTVVRDNNGAKSAAAVQAQVVVTAVNDAPTVTAPASITVTEDVASAISGISFADVDAAGGTVTANFNVTQGTLAATSGGSVTVGGNATNLTLTGTLFNINAFIAGSNLTYTTALDDTSAVNLAVSVHDGGNTGSGGVLASPVSNVTLNVSAVNDAPTGTVGITGIVTEDQILTAGNSLSDADGLGAVSYQWQRNGVNIAGANASTYTPDDVDVGNWISVTASYTDGGGNAESVTSAPIGPIANVNDIPTGSVTITGTLAEMQVLNADTSSIADDDGLGTLNYQWFRDGLGISGATNGSYTLGVNDIGASISVQVFYVDAHGTAESMGSAVVGPVGDVTIPPVPPTTGTSPDTTPRAEPPADTSPPETAAEEPAATTSAPLGTGDVAAPVPPPSGGVALPLDTVLGIEPSNVAGTSFVHDDSADSSQTPHQARLAPAGTGFNASYFAMQTTDLTVDQIPFVMTPTTALPSLDSGVNAIDAPEFSRELDRLRDSAEQQTRTAHTLVMTNLATTAGLSVGYLFWLLRTEVLLGSFLSSLPAWRLVDPLPVLGRLSDDDEDEDDESLESLVERRNRADRSTEPENTGKIETDIKAPESA